MIGIARASALAGAISGPGLSQSGLWFGLAWSRVDSQGGGAATNFFAGSKSPTR